MDILRDNLNVNAQSFLEGLAGIDNIEFQDFNIFNKSLTITPGTNWISENETSLDNLIASETIAATFIEVISTDVVINSIREFQKKYKKKSSIKNKIQSYVYDEGTKTLICKCNLDWTAANTTTLDNVIDALVGYDVITQLMNGYEKKEKDGHNYCNLKRSELVQSIITAVRTEAEAFEIDTKLKNVKDSLITGDWKTAQTYLGLTVVEGAYTQALKDEYNLEIQDYIDANY
jgi:hypothetical protein